MNPAQQSARSLVCPARSTGLKASFAIAGKYTHQERATGGAATRSTIVELCCDRAACRRPGMCWHTPESSLFAGQQMVAVHMLMTASRYPRDYNTVPRLYFWLLHLLWLFPLVRIFSGDRKARFKTCGSCWANQASPRSAGPGSFWSSSRFRPPRNITQCRVIQPWLFCLVRQ